MKTRRKQRGYITKYGYPGRNGVMGKCKPCCSRLAVEHKRKRRQRARLKAMAIATLMTVPLPAVEAKAERVPAGETEVSA